MYVCINFCIKTGLHACLIIFSAVNKLPTAQLAHTHTPTTESLNFSAPTTHKFSTPSTLMLSRPTRARGIEQESDRMRERERDMS